MSKLEQYGHNFQVKVLSTLVKDREFLQQVADIVSPDFFDNEANKWIIGKTLEYFNEFRTTPTMEVFKVEDITFCEECGLGYPDSFGSCPVCGTWKDD